jgi:hypothetical protein
MVPMNSKHVSRTFLHINLEFSAQEDYNGTIEPWIRRLCHETKDCYRHSDHAIFADMPVYGLYWLPIDRCDGYAGLVCTADASYRTAY